MLYSHYHLDSSCDLSPLELPYLSLLAGHPSDALALKNSELQSSLPPREK